MRIREAKAVFTCVCCPSIICNYKNNLVPIIYIHDGISLMFLQKACMHASKIWDFLDTICFRLAFKPSEVLFCVLSEELKQAQPPGLTY